MYLVRNKRRRITTLALIGKGVILQPRGKKGDSALLLDREIDETDVTAKKNMRAISLEKMPDEKPAQAPTADDVEEPPAPVIPEGVQVVEDDHHTEEERLRVEKTLEAEKRAAERNAAHEECGVKVRKKTSKRKTKKGN